MHFPSNKVRRYFTDPNYIVEDSKQVRTRRRQRNRNQRRQIIKDGWVDYEGEVIRSQDIQLEQNCPEETVAPSEVWIKKIIIHEEEALPEPPTTPSSESQDERIPGRLRKRRVPFRGLKNTERLAKSPTKLCCLFELHRIQGSKKTSRRRTS